MKMTVQCPKCQAPLRVARVRGVLGLECPACDYTWPREEEE